MQKKRRSRKERALLEYRQRKWLLVKIKTRKRKSGRRNSK